MDMIGRTNNEIKGMFEGEVLPVTARLAAPILLSNFFSSLFTIVDTYFISLIDQKSTALLSGPALVFPIVFLFLSLGIGLLTGISSLVSRSIGEKDYDTIDRAADSGLVISLIIIAATITAGYLFDEKIIKILAGSKLSKESIQYGNEFMKYLLPGLGILLFEYVLYGVLQGEGLTKYVAKSSILAGLSNIILEPVFIFTLGMGVKGAALATTFSYGISAVYLISIFVRKKSSISIKWKLTHARKKIIYEIIRIGFPESLGMLSIAVSFMFLNNIVSSIGEAAMNSWALCGRLDFIINVPAFALSSATLTMIGQNYGRKNSGRVKEIYKANIIYGLVMVLSMAVIYNLIAPHLYKFFTLVDEVIAGSVAQVRAVSFSYIGIATAMISASAFQAVGKPVPALVLRILRLGLLIIPPAYFLAIKMNLGMNGVFIAFSSGNIIIMIISWFWTKRYLDDLVL
jgi:putative MATE family efflux protein